MSPRFDRRREQGGAAGSGAGGGQAGRPFRGARPLPGRGGARPAFKPRGEWRPDGAERPDGGRPERRAFGRRPEGGQFSERRPGRADDRRPGGERRFDDRRPEGRRFEERREERRFEGRRPDGPRAEGRPAEGRFADGRRPQGRRPEGRRPFSSGGSDGRPPFRAGRPMGRPAVRPIVVEAPAAPEAERFNAGPADDLIWGRHAAQAALESGRPVHRIWCTPELRFQPRFLQLLREAKASGVLVEEVTWARLGQLTDGAVHQGIVMQAAAADTLDLGTLIDGCRTLDEAPLLLALDGVTDPHNLGAIVRSAEALGAHGLVLPQRRSAGLTGSVAKVAAGALEHLPVARVVNLNRSLDTLKQEGYRVIGLAGEGSVSLSEADLEGPLVIVTGSEGSGLSMLTRKHCDQLVRIPLRGATPSLNASVATAMVLYEVARRGWMKQISGTAPAPPIVRPQLPSPMPVSPPADVQPAEVQPVPVPSEAVQPEAEQPAPLLQDGEQPSVAVTAGELQQPDQEMLELGLNPADLQPFQADIQL
jgi:23S rRNA (guanosine2251-2'-O)-methyltransferase